MRYKRMSRNIFLISIIYFLLVTQVSESAVPHNTDTASLADSVKTKQDSLFFWLENTETALETFYELYSIPYKKVDLEQ